MEIDIQRQLVNILYSLLLGLLFGLFYDIIKIVHILCGLAPQQGEKRGMRGGKAAFWLFFLLDFLYMLVTGVVYMVFQYAVNQGQFRWYLAAGVLGGLFVYRRVCSPPVMAAADVLLRIGQKLLWMLLGRPLYCIVRMTGRAGRWIFSPLFRFFHRGACMWYTNRVRHRLHRDILFSPEKEEQKK